MATPFNRTIILNTKVSPPDQGNSYNFEIFFRLTLFRQLNLRQMPVNSTFPSSIFGGPKPDYREWGFACHCYLASSLLYNPCITWRIFTEFALLFAISTTRTCTPAAAWLKPAIRTLFYLCQLQILQLLAVPSDEFLQPLMLHPLWFWLCINLLS